jgi:hypothetical protein
VSKKAKRQRWIVYAQQIMPGNQSFRVTCHESLEWCKESFRRFSDAIGTDDVSASLYAYSDEAWQAAREFEGIGCPLDYPDRQIDRGPRGALVISNC